VTGDDGSLDALGGVREHRYASYIAARARGRGDRYRRQRGCRHPCWTIEPLSLLSPQGRRTRRCLGLLAIMKPFGSDPSVHRVKSLQGKHLSAWQWGSVGDYYGAGIVHLLLRPGLVAQPLLRHGNSSLGRSGVPDTFLALGNGFSFGADNNLMVWKPFRVRQAS
jgi:hypothetical protein